MICRAYLIAVVFPLVVLLSSSSQDPVKSLESEFFPLRVGAEKTYLVKNPKGKGDNKVTVKVARAEVVEIKRMELDPEDKDKKKLREVKVKVQAYQLESTSADRTPQSETVAVLEDGVYRLAALGKEFHPPVCFLKPPPRNGQATWQVQATTEGQTVQGTFISKEEIVNLNGQNVAAVKSYSNDFQMGKHKMEIEYWFVPQHGMVMQRVKVGSYEIVMTATANPNKGNGFCNRTINRSGHPARFSYIK